MRVWVTFGYGRLG